MFDNLLKFFAKIWASLKKIWVAFLDFTKYIKNWFIANYKVVIKKYPRAKPIALKVKENLKNKNFNTLDLGMTGKGTVIKTFYDEQTGEILEDHTEVVEFNELDEETQRNFGDKDMLVLS